jgi:hypothetical protein
MKTALKYLFNFGSLSLGLFLGEGSGLLIMSSAQTHPHAAINHTHLAAIDHTHIAALNHTLKLESNVHSATSHSVLARNFTAQSAP